MKQDAAGALTAIADVPFMNSVEIAHSDPDGHYVRHRTLFRSSGDRPAAEIDLVFRDGKVLATRHGLREDWDAHELTVPGGAHFDPNSRPDSYTSSHLLLRAFAVKPGEPGEFTVFDWDNSGNGLVDYRIRVEHVGRDRVEVPAGTFEANHLVLTQASSADTWFKKRAGHTTEFWVLDDQVIVRIRRNREPYEVALLDVTVPDSLPNLVSDSPEERAAAEASASARYLSDWTAFVREVDQTYPFFELKGIREDWNQAKASLTERVKACEADPDFLWIVIEAIRCLRDAHMGVSQTQVAAPDLPPQYYPGVSLMQGTEGRVLVMAAVSYSEVLKPGTVVTRIDGRAAREVLEENAREAWSAASPYRVFVSSPQRARLFAYRWPLIASSQRTHTLHYLDEGQERPIEVTCSVEPRGWPHTYNLPAGLRPADRSTSYTRLPSGVGYLYLRSVGPGTPGGIDQALQAHPDAKGWIVDLRGNGGGGYDSELLTRLKGLPRPVVALIDAGCISAGETLARDLVQLAGARLMGSRTAGASSSKRQWSFPSGLASITLSTRSRWRADGKPIEYHGIEPDEAVEAVPEEVARGLNSQIRRAEEYLLGVAVSE